MILTTIALLGGLSTSAQTPSFNNSPASQSAYNPTTVSTATQSAANRLQQALARIRQDALRQQAADGGTLTEEHRAGYQERIDAANQRFAAYLPPH